MSQQETMVRTEIAINGAGVYLAQDQDIEALKRRFEAAAQTSGVFVEFIVLGNRSVSVLVSSQTHIVISRVTLPFDSRDTGDEEQLFGGFYDL